MSVQTHTHHMCTETCRQMYTDMNTHVLTSTQVFAEVIHSLFRPCEKDAGTEAPLRDSVRRCGYCVPEWLLHPPLLPTQVGPRAARHVAERQPYPAVQMEGSTDVSAQVESVCTYACAKLLPHCVKC